MLDGCQEDDEPTSHIRIRNAAQAATTNRISVRVLELWGNDQRVRR